MFLEEYRLLIGHLEHDTYIWGLPGQLLQWGHPSQRFYSCAITYVNHVLQYEEPFVSLSARPIKNGDGQSLNHLSPSFKEILVLLMGFTLEIVNRIHPKYVLHSIANFCFPPITDQQVHCSSMADRIR